jgi:hypothetical protein
MKVKIILTLMTVIIIGMFTMPAWALEKGNERKGKYIYRKVYKTCQARGAVDSPKPILNPDAKTQAEWAAIFEKKDFSDFVCVEEFNNLAEKDLLDIFTYLHAHASDSGAPLKCK